MAEAEAALSSDDNSSVEPPVNTRTPAAPPGVAPKRVTDPDGAPHGTAPLDRGCKRTRSESLGSVSSQRMRGRLAACAPTGDPGLGQGLGGSGQGSGSVMSGSMRGRRLAGALGLGHGCGVAAAEPVGDLAENGNRDAGDAVAGAALPTATHPAAWPKACSRAASGASLGEATDGRPSAAAAAVVLSEPAPAGAGRGDPGRNSTVSPTTAGQVASGVGSMADGRHIVGVGASAASGAAAAGGGPPLGLAAGDPAQRAGVAPAPSILCQTAAALGLWEQLHETASTPSTVLAPVAARRRVRAASSLSTHQSAT